MTIMLKENNSMIGLKKPKNHHKHLLHPVFSDGQLPELRIA